MLPERMKHMLTDRSVTDEQVIGELKTFMADQFDEKGAIIPPSDEDLADLELLHTLAWKFRPGSMLKLEEELQDQHKECLF